MGDGDCDDICCLFMVIDFKEANKDLPATS